MQAAVRSRVPLDELTLPYPAPSLSRVPDHGGRVTYGTGGTMKRVAVAVAGLMLVACAPAWALGKGGSMLAIELTNGTADFADKLAGTVDGSNVAAYVTAYEHSE